MPSGVSSNFTFRALCSIWGCAGDFLKFQLLDLWRAWSNLRLMWDFCRVGAGCSENSFAFAFTSFIKLIRYLFVLLKTSFLGKTSIVSSKAAQNSSGASNPSLVNGSVKKSDRPCSYKKAALKAHFLFIFRNMSKMPNIFSISELSKVSCFSLFIPFCMH